MTRAQRLVRVGVWILLPFMLLGSFDLAATLAAAFAEERDTLTLPSPSGRYAATIARTKETCGDSRGNWNSIVYVQRRFAGINTGMASPLCVEGEAAKVALAWDSEETLRISCTGCSIANYEMSAANWGRLRLEYDLDH